MARPVRSRGGVTRRRSNVGGLLDTGAWSDGPVRLPGGAAGGAGRGWIVRGRRRRRGQCGGARRRTRRAHQRQSGVGINASTYDASLLDAKVPSLLRGAGVSLIRLPGGTESDEYDWKTSTDVISSAKEAVNFGQFMSVVR